MRKNPTEVKIEDRIYKINTSYKVALECDKVARDTSIDDVERAMSIIYLLYGEKGLNANLDWNKLLELGQKYLSMGKEVNNKENKRDMDYEQDFDYIKASFMSDYNIDLEEKDMHWWTFYNLLCGLSNSELGNCCVLNRVRNLRNFDLSQIKDAKTKQKIREAQKQVQLKKEEKKLTKEQESKMNDFYKSIGWE